MTPRLLLIPALFCFLLLPGAAGPAFPGPESPGASARPKTRPPTMQRGPAAPAGAFAERDRERIRRYFRREAPGLPPGLARRGGDLPPGLEKQLRVGGHLPPGLEKKVSGFPAELERSLPAPGPGLRRGMLGGRAVLFDGETSLILDIVSIF